MKDINLLYQIFNDSDLRTSILPSEHKLVEFITILYLNSYNNYHNYKMYKGILPF